ncbi:MAG TPA: hypothetical protein VFA59_05710 [Vicinamibacterales bacterium]|nr:hypothetical protein [Vicinamibacterales bacterium]
MTPTRAGIALVVVACVAAALLYRSPASFSSASKPLFPSTDRIHLEDFDVQSDGLHLTLANLDNLTMTIAQVQVDSAYWAFRMDPTATLAPNARATLVIPYEWDQSDPITVNLVTSLGATMPFELTPENSLYRIPLRSWRAVPSRQLMMLAVASVAAMLLITVGLRRTLPIAPGWRDAALVLVSVVVVWQVLQGIMTNADMAMLLPPTTWHGTSSVIVSAVIALIGGLLLQAGARRTSSADTATVAVAAAFAVACHVTAAGLLAADAASKGQDAIVAPLFQTLFVVVSLRAVLPAFWSSCATRVTWTAIGRALVVGAVIAVVPAILAPSVRTFVWGPIVSAATLGADIQLLVALWSPRRTALAHVFA